MERNLPPFRSSTLPILSFLNRFFSRLPLFLYRFPKISAQPNDCLQDLTLPAP